MTLPAAHLIDLTEAALACDYSRLRKTGQLIAKALEPEDPEGARRLRLALNRKGVPLQASGVVEMLPVDGRSRLPLVEEHQWPTTPIFLEGMAQAQFGHFLTDVTHFEDLAAKGVASRLCLMLSGPPGTGKTLLAGHVASQLGRKLYVARLDSMISSMLGDTAKNIRSVFDFVAGKQAVLFLDEMDAIAKMRDDRHELGELKRVVNTVIQGIDSLDERAVVVAATNHAQLLDKAIWRRFPYKIDLDVPGVDLRGALWGHFLGEDSSEPLVSALARLAIGMSGAEIEQAALSARRQSIVQRQPLDTLALATAVLRAPQGPGAGGINKPKSQADAKRAVAQALVLQHGMAQSDVARLLGMTRQSISGYIKATAHGH